MFQLRPSSKAIITGSSKASKTSFKNIVLSPFPNNEDISDAITPYHSDDTEMDEQICQWFFLTLKRCHPNFVTSKAKKNVSAIWVRLSELPTEFYNQGILTLIENKLGRLVKMDMCTSSILRGLYAHICVEVPIGIIVKEHIRIGQHKQPLIYEGSNILCTNCGVLSHINTNCTKKDNMGKGTLKTTSAYITKHPNSQLLNK
ncbi:hypothetical protein R3W88_031577 [Solanum pinnatisectum]|uniref:DUF4283 domain-containing protein n=1 Tax=Solanum pinnatisectum TaxID=50273 RepID=A0AAV9LPC4_9SOLN|nr:hypothetical protein R3W88_031577 [Solanum pinnatisectum]